MLQNTGNKNRRETQLRTHERKTETFATSRANKGVLIEVQMRSRLASGVGEGGARGEHVD